MKTEAKSLKYYISIWGIALYNELLELKWFSFYVSEIANLASEISKIAFRNLASGYFSNPDLTKPKILERTKRVELAISLLLAIMRVYRGCEIDFGEN